MARAWHLMRRPNGMPVIEDFALKEFALPALDDVRYKYLYGSDFSEEGPGASPIAADPTLRRGFR